MAPITEAQSAAKPPHWRVVWNEAVERGREDQWTAALELAVSPPLADIPEGITLQIMAASKLRDDAAVKEAVAKMRGPKITDRFRMATASQLCANMYPDEAWQVVEWTEDRTSYRLPTLLILIAQRSTNKEIRRLAGELRRSLLNIRSGVNAAASSEKVPVALTMGISDRPLLSHFKVIADPRHERHKQKFIELDEAFQQKLKTVVPPPVDKYINVYVNADQQIWTEKGEPVFTARKLFNPTPGSRVIEEAVLCTEPNRNFYHWLAEKVASLSWVFVSGEARFKALTVPNPPKFQLETLRMLGWRDEDIVPLDEAVFCKSLYVHRTPLSLLARRNLSGNIYKRLATSAHREAPGRSWPKRVFISRRDARNRRLNNEEQLIEGLAEFDVAAFNMSELSLAEQFELFRNAECVIGLHGAGLAHLVVADPGLRILELAPIFNHNYGLISNMGRLSRCRGHDHTLWIEEPNPLVRGWAIDVERVTSFVREWLQAE